MQELEKIIGKIEMYIRSYQNPPYGREVEGTVELLEQCKEIIRKYIKPKETFKFNFSGVKSFDCQCGRHYINTADDDGWIPVEERLPEKYGKYLVTVLPPAGHLWIKVFIAHFSDLMGIIKKPIFFIGNVGKNDLENITDEVIAWQPLPEPYKAERMSND